MILLLDDTKDLTELVNDKTNGIGKLNVLNCYVEEELNGIYELTFDIAVNDTHFDDIKQGGLIKANAGEIEGGQIFRIIKISKQMNEIVNVKCVHITYDLNKAVVYPFTSKGATDTVNKLIRNKKGNYPFTMTTNIDNTSSDFVLDIPRSFRECLGGYSGSVLDVFRGEYEYDNLSIKMLSRRGSDTNVRIAYGKNLTDIQQDENIESVYNAIVGYAIFNEQTYTGDIQYLVETDTPKTQIVDFSNEFDDENIPTKAKLNTLAKNYATSNKINMPSVSISVSFVPLWQTNEYKDIAPLERLGLGDTIMVDFPKLNISANARVVRRKWNVLLERYEEIELGEAHANLTSAITNSIVNPTTKQFAKQNNAVVGALNQVTELVTNGLGLFTTEIEVDGGGTKYYLHNRPELSDSQYQWTINDGVFAVSSDYGKTWNAGITTDGDAVFNVLSANIVNAMELYGSTIVFDAKKSPVTARGSNAGENGGVIFTGDGDFTVQTKSVGIRANGESSGYEMQITGYASNVLRNFIALYNTYMTLYHYGSNGKIKSALNLRDSSVELDFYDANGNNIIGQILINSSGITFNANDSNGNNKVRVDLNNSTGIGVYINGNGYAGLGFVNDGNGHAVLGK